VKQNLLSDIVFKIAALSMTPRVWRRRRRMHDGVVVVVMLELID
jgi:hypothetical protein